MLSISILVPWRSDDPRRIAVWDWCRNGGRNAAISRYATPTTD